MLLRSFDSDVDFLFRSGTRKRQVATRPNLFSVTACKVSGLLGWGLRLCSIDNQINQPLYVMMGMSFYTFNPSTLSPRPKTPLFQSERRRVRLVTLPSKSRESRDLVSALLWSELYSV